MDAGKYRVAHVLMFLLLFLASGGFFIVMAPQYVSVVWLSYYIYRKIPRHKMDRMIACFAFVIFQFVLLILSTLFIRLIFLGVDGIADVIVLSFQEYWAYLIVFLIPSLYAFSGKDGSA